MQKKLTYSFRNNVSKIPVRNLRRVKIRGKWKKNFRTSQNQLANSILKDIMKGLIENISPFYFQTRQLMLIAKTNMMGGDVVRQLEQQHIASAIFSRFLIL